LIKIKQVFSSYNFQEKSSLYDFIYCSSCGNKCVKRILRGQERSVCPICGFVHYKNPSPAVSVLLVKNEKILLGKRVQGSFKAGMWCLPCGFIEFDEDFLTAARREVQEETGFIIEIESIISVMSNYLTPNLHSLVVVLLAHVVGGALCPGDDLDQVEWFSISEPLPQMAFEADEHIITRYFQTRITGVPVETDLPVIGCNS
jgi:8-oxo-dGTP diphosphatase